MPVKPVHIPAQEVEVMPREDTSRRHPSAGGLNDALPRIIALLLDNLIKVPGAKRGVGLNPIFDFLPGVGEFGDAAATLISSLTILEGARRGVPKIVLARMAGNVLLNGMVGVIPFVGGMFAWWFRPSQRNYDLFRLHTSNAVPARRSTAADWVFVVALMGGMLLIAALFIGLGLWVSLNLFKWVINPH